MMLRLLFLFLCGALLAGIIHICVILLIPFFGNKDAARQIMHHAPSLKFASVNSIPNLKIAEADPFFYLSVCKFSVEDATIQISAESYSDFWSASVYGKDGKVEYSLNDRTAIGNRLRMLIVDPIQMAALRQLQPEELETSIVVEMSEKTGFILVRSLIRDQSYIPHATGFLDSISCEPYDPI